MHTSTRTQRNKKNKKTQNIAESRKNVFVNLCKPRVVVVIVIVVVAIASRSSSGNGPVD